MSVAIVIQTLQEVYGSLKETNMNNENPADVTTDDSSSFKYKSSSMKESTAVNYKRVFTDVKIAVPTKYLSNFWRSLEMPLINCKIHLELNWMSQIIRPGAF